MDNMLMPYIWDLSDHIKEQVEKTEVGDMIHINEPLMPAVFQNDENVYLFAFTSEETIPKEYIKEYAIVKVTIQQILLEFLAIERILGKSPLLMINPFDDENMIFAKEQLKEML